MMKLLWTRSLVRLTPTPLPPPQRQSQEYRLVVCGRKWFSARSSCDFHPQNHHHHLLLRYGVYHPFTSVSMIQRRRQQVPMADVMIRMIQMGCTNDSQQESQTPQYDQTQPTLTPIENLDDDDDDEKKDDDDDLTFRDFSPSARDTPRAIVASKQRALELLNERQYPRGCYTPSMFQECQWILDRFRRVQRIDDDTVRLTISFIDRIVAEVYKQKNVLQRHIPNTHIEWLFQPNYLDPIFEAWKQSYKQGNTVKSAGSIAKHIMNWRRQIPDLRYYDIAVEYLLHCTTPNTDFWRYHNRNKSVARILLDPKINPSFSTVGHFREAKAAIDMFYKVQDTHVDPIRLIAQLMHRSVLEQAKLWHKQQSDATTTTTVPPANHVEYLCHASYFDPLIHLMVRNQILSYNNKAISQKRFIRQLKQMAQSFEPFRPVAPVVAETFLSKLKFATIEHKCPDVLQGHNCAAYTELLSCWSISPDPNLAGEKIEATLETMRSDGVSPNHQTYRVVVEFWKRQENMDKIDECWKQIQESGLPMDVLTCAHFLSAYATHEKTLEHATEVLNHMDNIHTKTKDSPNAKIACNELPFFLSSCLDFIQMNVDTSMKEKAVLMANHHYERVIANDKVYPSQKKKATHMMVDLYEHAGMKDVADILREQSSFLSPSIIDDSEQLPLITGKFDIVAELTKLQQKPSGEDSVLQFPI